MSKKVIIISSIVLVVLAVSIYIYLKSNKKEAPVRMTDQEIGEAKFGNDPTSPYYKGDIVYIDDAVPMDAEETFNK